MRHATPADLDRLEPLLSRLRELEALRERKRGNFARNSRAFLHFHADGEELFADVRLTDDFERHRVTSTAEREQLLDVINEALDPTP
jgi:hypothetical protein